ncbi:hypothetical protein [Nocardia inohanensis]|uniref:hypothetical protein n=1 Tax=Nocardia inohanensis TaxID=209246 RepID=UPI000834A5AF|nr:hypothetical protein [Nocardia inohanensis]
MRSPTDHTARLRGAAVGAASGAVAILAHALGGGTAFPDSAALTLLFTACVLIGVVVASLRPRHGLLSLMGMLAAGQTIGHTALTMSPGHHHHHGLTPVMLAAHLLAIPLGAFVIRAAEAGLRRALTSVRRFILHLFRAPQPPVRHARRIRSDDRARAQQLLVTPGIARRGPPRPPHSRTHLIPA